MKMFAILVGAVLGGGILLATGLWALDVRNDRNHTVSIKGATPVFQGDEELCDAGKAVTEVQQGSTFQAQRIRYWKGCATISIQLNDGRRGYVVLGVGNASVYPNIP